MSNLMLDGNSAARLRHEEAEDCAARDVAAFHASASDEYHHRLFRHPREVHSKPFQREAADWLLEGLAENFMALMRADYQKWLDAIAAHDSDECGTLVWAMIQRQAAAFVEQADQKGILDDMAQQMADDECYERYDEKEV